MGKQVFTNNASTEILGAINDSATSITLNTGRGDMFAAPTGGDYQLATLSSPTAVEIIKITARSGDVLTVARGQEGTTAVSWASLSTIEGRVTKETLDRFLQNPNATASGTNAIAIGTSSDVQGTGSVGIGDTAKTFGNQQVAIGSTSQAQGLSSVAIGYLSDTYNDYDVALGHNVQVQGVGSVGIGKNAATFGAAEIAVGEDSQAQGLSSISIGKMTDTYHDYDIAIGHNTQVSVAGATGIGKDAVSEGADAIGVGTFVHAAGTDAIAIGHYASALNPSSIAIGLNANNPDVSATPAAWASATAYARHDVRLISGRRCRVTLDGTSGGSAPTVPGTNGDYFLDGTASTGVVWTVDELISQDTVSIGTGAYGFVSIGPSAKSVNGVAIGYDTDARESSVAVGTYARCLSKNSIALGLGAYNPQVNNSLAVSAMPVLAPPSDWLFGTEYQEYVALVGLLSSELIDLTGGPAWAATTQYRHGAIVRPVTPNGKQYSRWCNNYKIFSGKDPKLLHYVAGNSGGSEPTWTTALGDSVTDGDGEWICIPNDGTYKLNLPCDMLVEEVMFICYLATGVSVQANISIGTTGNLTKIINNQPTVGLTADKTVTKWVPAQPVIVPDITIKIDTLATGTKMWGRFVFKGFYTKYV